MKKTWKRVFSAALTLVMALSLLPAGAMAAEEEAQSISLPLVAEEEVPPAAQGLGRGMSVFALRPRAAHTAYIYEGVTEENYYYFQQAKILDAQGNPIVYDYNNPTIPENGTFQVVDGDGNILAYTEPDSYYSNVTETDPETNQSVRYYCIDSEYFIVDEDYAETGMPEGEYSVRLVAGEKVYPTEAKAVVVDESCLLLSYLSIQDLYYGKDEFELYLRLYGFETEEQVAEMSFVLTDKDGNKIASSTGNIRDIYKDNRGAVEWRLYAQMKVEEGKALEENASYTLTVNYSGEKTLVDGAGSVTRNAYEAQASIEEFLILDADTTSVRIAFAGTDPEKTYRLVVSESNGADEPLARYEGKIQDDSLTLQLRRGGIIVPATMYENNFSVELQEKRVYNEGTEWESVYWNSCDSQNYENLYRNIRNEYVYFSPYYMRLDAQKVAFEIEGQGISYFTGEGDVLSMRDKNGVEVGRCDKMTYETFGYNCIISGELTITGQLKKNTYYLYLNNVQFDTVYVSDSMRGSWDLQTFDYSGLAFWKFMDQLSIGYEGVYTAGTGTFSFRTQNGVDVLTSGVVTGQDMYYTDYKHYKYSFTAEELSKLTPGTGYQVVFKSGGVEATYGGDNEWYVYTTEKTPLDLYGNNDLYYRWWQTEVGDTTVELEFSRDNRNMVASDLDAVKALTLVNTTTADTFAITGWQNLQMEPDGYWTTADMVLDKPLTIGDYEVRYNGETIDSFNVYSKEQSRMPHIWGGEQVINGYLSAENLPQTGTYTAKVYQGYNCVIATPIPLTLHTYDEEGLDQDLTFDKNLLNDLPSGTYEMRITLDGKFFGETDFSIIRLEKPIVIISDEDNNYDDDNDPVIDVAKVRIEISNVGAYGYLRWAETKEALAEQPFQVYFSNRWYGHTFAGDAVNRKLYVELSPTGKADDAENLLVEKDLWLMLNGADYDVQVPADIQGVKKVKNNAEYTITATASIPATRIWVAFYDADGRHASQPMAYVGETQDGRYEFALSFDPTDSFYDHSAYRGSFDYENTQRIEVFAVNLSDTYHNDEQYRGDKVGKSVERVLIFGDPTRVVLLDDYISTNQANYKLVGYTVANGTVSVTERFTSGTVIATGTGNELGYFEITLPTLTEGTHYLTVSDNSNTIDSSDLTLDVDLTAPVITGATFDYVEGTALIRWGCQDDDVNSFVLYKNNVKIGEIYYDYGTTSYSSNVTAKYNDGNVFTIEAVDQAGNVGTITVTTDDLQAPTAPGMPYYTVLKAKRIELGWAKAVDNVGVERYDIYRDGVKIGESTTNTYIDKTVSPETAYTYTVVALDAKNNASPVSGELKITTPVAPAGVVVKGEISSYNPGVSTTIQFKQDGEVAYGATIGATTGSGEATQTFQPEDAVAEGTYDVVISKDGHLDLTIKGVVVGDEDLDLGSILKDVTLVAGDVNDDGAVNSDDLNNVWSTDNYLKSTTDGGVDSAADVNGDGKVNSDDLNIIWSTNNYLKVEADCVITLK